MLIDDGRVAIFENHVRPEGPEAIRGTEGQKKFSKEDRTGHKSAVLQS
jgi:hypothetical protein